MKKYLYALILLFTACNDAEKPAPFPYIPPEDTVRVVFDIETFNKNTIRYMEENGDSSVADDYTYYTPEGVKIVQFDLGERGYQEEHFHKTYTDFYRFYPSGRLKVRSFYFSRDGKNADFPIGNRYTFDEQGKLIDVENKDAPYKYTLNDVLAFLDSLGVKPEDRGVSISRREEVIKGSHIDEEGRLNLTEDHTGKFKWWLAYPFYEKHAYRELILDAETGAILKDSIWAP